MTVRESCSVNRVISAESVQIPSAFFTDRVFCEPFSDSGEVVSEVVVYEIEVSVELF